MSAWLLKLVNGLYLEPHVLLEFTGDHSIEPGMQMLYLRLHSSTHKHIYLCCTVCTDIDTNTLAHSKHFPGKQTPYIDFSMIVVIRLSPIHSLSLSFYLIHFLCQDIV